MWVEDLQRGLWENPNPSELLNSCKHLQHGITLTAKLMSGHIFYLLYLTLASLILVVYGTTSFFFSQIEMTWPIKMLFAGYIALGIKNVFVVRFINLTSQKLQDELSDLRRALEDTYFSDKQLVEIDGNCRSPKELRDLLTKRFEEFKGFDGYGYFHLGKSLLTCCQANFVTYLIVLIQFRISEIST